MGSSGAAGREGRGGREAAGRPARVAGGLLALLLMVGTPARGQGPIEAGPPAAPAAMAPAPFQAEPKPAANIAWVVAAGGLASFMAAGLALAGTGLARAKNASHSAAMVLGAVVAAVLGFWASGFALMFGGFGAFPTLESGDAHLDAMLAVRWLGRAWDIAGARGFFLLGNVGAAPGVLAAFFFHAVLIGVAVTIPVGAMLERWRFGAALLFGGVAAALIAPTYGAWAWGGGWLADLGTMGLGVGLVDFAGSGVIHLTGGVMALAGALSLGPRIGKANSDGTPNAIPGHNVPMAIVGSLVLAGGWLGVNLGRTLDPFDPRVPGIAAATLMAGASGCLASLAMTRQVFRKPDPTMGCNGLLAGLVAISAPCACVSPAEATLIGCLAGLLVVVSILFVERTLLIDDPVGAVSVHGTCGAFGLLCVGLFARDRPPPGPGAPPAVPVGFFTSGDLGQLGAQAVGVAANLAWVFPTSLVAFALINRLVGNRVAAGAEIEGLDVPEMGVLGYVGEETYAVRTAGQDFLATFGPGVPPKAASKSAPPVPARPTRPGPPGRRPPAR